MIKFYPEGQLIGTSSNTQIISSLHLLAEAMENKTILEGRAILCDADHNLTVELGNLRGIIPRNEGAIGIEEGTTRDIAIISRVNKPVCFVVVGFERKAGTVTPILSRRQAQQLCTSQYISTLTVGSIISGRITHMEPFGCFVDIGCGIPSLLPIDSISISRISHPKDRFVIGQNIYGVVKSIENGRICLSHKELLGNWQQNADMFSPGQTVAGIVRSVESYGVFVELAPNLAGLAEPKEGVRPGQHASVYIKSLLPEKMKVKLIIIDSFDASYPPNPITYFHNTDYISHWQYSPPECPRVLESNFQ